MSRRLIFTTVAGNYVEYIGKTAYLGHGGDEIDTESTAPVGVTVASCEARCDSDTICDCVSFRPSDGKCWKRGNCVPSQFGTDGNFNTYVKTGGGSNYVRYASKTAYYGHGGTEIDSESSAPTGLSVASCEGRCDSDSSCECVSLRLADGKCWKRGACVPSQFASDPNFDTYVKISGPSPTPPTPAPTPSPLPSGTVSATTLHWNVHRPCGTDNSACISTAKQRLAAMVNEVGAQLVGVVELKYAIDALPGWQNSGMQCDNSAVMVAPGWSITGSGGYCMNGDDAKGFAVAKVTPPQQVQGCPSLCVVMGHVPHGDGSVSGNSEISRVCGSAVGCTVMMGDWNAEDISSRWASLIGGSPVLVEPHDKTCCYGSPGYIFAYDHTATNIASAYSAGKKVHDPQLTSFPSYNEHMPVSIQLKLPSAGFGAVNASDVLVV